MEELMTYAGHLLKMVI